jgi:EmrB/QacA subfamily drug resistance transporter
VGLGPASSDVVRCMSVVGNQCYETVTQSQHRGHVKCVTILQILFSARDMSAKIALGHGRKTVYENIVCGVLPAESALNAARHATELGSRFDATVHMVVSFEGPTDPNTFSNPGARIGRREAEQFLAREFDSLPNVRTHALPGNPAHNILQVAHEFDADLIVVGNRGMQGAHRMIGSVPNTVSHQANCAVLIVNGTSATRLVEPGPAPAAVAAPVAAGLEPYERLTPRQRTRVLIAMCLALVLVIAGVAMMSVALPAIGTDLGLSQTNLTWVADAYAVVLAALLLFAGALGDRFGRRRALLIGMAIYAVGSLVSAFATSGGQLISLRALTGVGAALVMPGTLSTITSVFPPEERARAVGIWAGFAGAGGTIGLLCAGWLLDSHSWQTVFYVTSAVAVVTFVAILAFVPDTRAREHVGLDPLGTVFSALGIGALVLGIIEGPMRGWSDPLTVGALVFAVAMMVAFVLWELRIDHPLLDPRLFRFRGFSTGSASLLVMFMALFGLMIVVMQYLQLVLGYSPLKAALSLLPMTVVLIPIAAAAAPLSERFGQKLVCATGLAVSAVAFLTFSTLGPTSGFGLLLLGQLFLAVGIGLSTTPATNAIVSSLPLAKQGVASAVNDTTREIGTALGIALMGSMFNTGYRNAISGHLAGTPAQIAAQAKQAPAIALAIASKLGAPGLALAAAARTAFASGLRLAMFVGAGLLVAGAVFVWAHGPSHREEKAEDVVDLSVDRELESV